MGLETDIIFKMKIRLIIIIKLMRRDHHGYK